MFAELYNIDSCMTSPAKKSPTSLQKKKISSAAETTLPTRLVIIDLPYNENISEL